MDTSAYLLHRVHFGFTATFHYLFPQLTMGLALLVVVLQTLALRRKEALYGQAARSLVTMVCKVAMTPQLAWTVPGRNQAASGKPVSPSKANRGKYWCCS